jgi:FdhD protein
MIETNAVQPAVEPPRPTGRETAAPVVRVRGAAVSSTDDWLAVERPLQIQARTGGETRVVSTTMRTPGDDQALAVGFLYGERVITDRRQIGALESIDDDTVRIELDAATAPALRASQRPFVTTGACGVCGRLSLDGMEPTAGAGDPPLVLARAVIHGLPEALRARQATFARTGGLHAAGLFTAGGAPLAAFEDVGRHNAVDKLVGTLLLAGRLPAPDAVLVVSGRASFELAQKAAVAGFGALVAVGAPSSLAVDVARRAGMILIGFARADGFNVYCGAQRVAGIPEAIHG